MQVRLHTVFLGLLTVWYLRLTSLKARSQISPWKLEHDTMKSDSATHLLSVHPTLLLVALSIVAYVLSLVRWHIRSKGRPLPPGPKSLPFIGTALHMRSSELWQTNRELCETYGEYHGGTLYTSNRSTANRRIGDVVYVPVLGQDMLLLGSAQAVFDLLEKQSALSSDRQHSPLISLSVYHTLRRVLDTDEETALDKISIAHSCLTVLSGGVIVEHLLNTSQPP